MGDKKHAGSGSGADDESEGGSDVGRSDVGRSGVGRSDVGTSGQVFKQLKYLTEEVTYNRSRINDIESKLSNYDGPRPRRAFSGADGTGVMEAALTDDGTETTEDFMFFSAKKTIPEVRECTFAQFKNRFDPRGRDGRFAVDVLVSGPLLHQETQQERSLRNQLFGGASQNAGAAAAATARNAKDKFVAKAVKMANVANNMIEEAQSELSWPRRIRIQAPALLRILARINREKWTDRPRTYYRPFHGLVLQHEEMREALERLEERWGAQLDAEIQAGVPLSEDQQPAAAGQETGRDHDGDGDKTNDASSEDEEDEKEGDEDEEEEEEGEACDSVTNSTKALACMRAYVTYFDENIMSDYHRFEKKDVSSNAKVRFSDLWYLFRTGELVYRPVEGEMPEKRETRTGKRIWKVYNLDPRSESQVAAASDDPEVRGPADKSEDSSFKVGCYYVDYTGDGFCIVKTKVSIDQFDGETPIGGLPIYPLRFCQGWKGRLAEAEKAGDSLLEFLDTKHCFYNGWTLTQTRSGDTTLDGKKSLHQPEHIESEVMVDFHEAFQQYPAWRPRRSILRQKIPQGKTVPEPFRIRWWSSIDRTKLLGETTELLPSKTGASVKQRNRFLANDPFVKIVAENEKRQKPTTAKDLTPETKALLTGRVFAYVFQERKFAQLAVGKLLPCPKTGLALESLKIPATVKRAIQGSVRGHFLQKAAETSISRTSASLDLIQGKGTGLFILLHGVPGVGKTATAEAIAQANGKPLFKITVGDLGMTPEKVEVSLRDIFRLASIWDCILLLDEVDTFFSSRSRADTAANKNALVSVFLRVLDYYNGILFLTTNRAGVLDEAFKSRIHYKIYYPDLTLEQTLDIWNLNIQRLRRIEKELAAADKREPLQINEQELLRFASHCFHQGSMRKQGQGRWNGRQIRNAFQVARSLAYYEHELQQQQQQVQQQQQKIPLYLDVRHFQTMHDITASFDNYITAIHGGVTDAELAAEAEERIDTYRDNLTDGLQAEYRKDHIGGDTNTERADNGGNGAAGDESEPYSPDALSPGSQGLLQRSQQQQQQQQQQKQQQQQYFGDSVSVGESYTLSSTGQRSRHSSVVGRDSRANSASNNYLSNQGGGTGMQGRGRGQVVLPQQYQQQQQQRYPVPPSTSPHPFGGGARGPGYGGSASAMRSGSAGGGGGGGGGLPFHAGGSGSGFRGSAYETGGGGGQGGMMQRGPSPRIEEGAMPTGVMGGGGRDYAPQDAYGHRGSGASLSPQDEPRNLPGGSSYISGGRPFGTGGQGFGNQFSGHGFNSHSGTQIGQNPETDLAFDEGS